MSKQICKDCDGELLNIVVNKNVKSIDHDHKPLKDRVKRRDHGAT